MLHRRVIPWPSLVAGVLVGILLLASIPPGSVKADTSEYQVTVNGGLSNGLIEVTVEGAPPELFVTVKNTSGAFLTISGLWLGLTYETIGNLTVEPFSPLERFEILPPGSANHYSVHVEGPGAVTFFTDVTATRAQLCYFLQNLFRLAPGIGALIGEAPELFLELVVTFDDLREVIDSFVQAFSPGTGFFERTKLAWSGATGLADLFANEDNLVDMANFLWDKYSSRLAANGFANSGAVFLALKQAFRFKDIAEVLLNSTQPMAYALAGIVAGSSIIEINRKTANVSPNVSVSPEIITVGTRITATWTGCSPDGTITQYVRQLGNSSSETSEIIADRQGHATSTINSQGLQPGTYELWGVDNKTGTRSNIATFTLTGSVDLSAYVVEYSPDSLSAGDTLLLTFGVKNNGGSDAGQFATWLFASSSPYGTNLRLGKIPFRSLAAGAAEVSIASLIMPDSVPNGQYYLTAYVDAPGTIPETNENNNIGSSAPQTLVVTNKQSAGNESSPSGGDVNLVADIALKYWGKDSAIVMIAIAGAESNWNVTAGGDTPQSLRNLGYPTSAEQALLFNCPLGSETGPASFGLWQIFMPVHKTMLGSIGAPINDPCSTSQWLMDPENNAKAAFEIWRSQGFGAWSQYNNGKYEDYLAASREAVDTNLGNRTVKSTIYIHQYNTAGSLLSGVTVFGYDGEGNYFSQVTNSSGYVALAGQPGMWQFTASKTGYTTKSWAQVIEAETTQQVFLVRQVEDVTLKLYVHQNSTSGPVIPGAQVTCLNEDGYSFTQTTNSAGYVTITEKPGTWDLTVSKAGYEVNTWSQQIEANQTLHAYLKRQSDDITVKLYVHKNSTSGPVISGATAQARDNEDNTFSGTTDSSGYVTFTGRPGTWSFTLSRNDYESKTWTQTYEQDTTQHVFLTENKPDITFKLYIHKNSSSGPIISGASVTGQDAKGTQFNKTTNSSGYVSITGAPGTWQFTVSRSGYETKSWSQRVEAAASQHAFIRETASAVNPPELGTVGVSANPWPPQPFLMTYPGTRIYTQYSFSYSGPDMMVNLVTTVMDGDGNKIGQQVSGSAFSIVNPFENPISGVAVEYDLPSGATPGFYNVKFAVWNADLTTEYDSVTMNGCLEIIGAPVTLTLRFHENTVSGTPLSGVTVSCQDGIGNVFSATSDASGYATITGTPGTWSFSASKSGYATNDWTQSITVTETRHAYLVKQAAASVTLTLYVHDISLTGPLIPWATVTGQDGEGHSFSFTTGADGYGTVTGSSGGWTFTITKSGYETKTWSDSISSSGERHVQMTASSNMIGFLLYVHENTTSGPTLPDATVTGYDGDGNTFSLITGSPNGDVIITGVPGTWSFNVSKTGYTSISWTLTVSANQAKHVALVPVNAEVTIDLYVHENSTNGPVVGGATVTGHDGDGTPFNLQTNSNGYVIITGTPGAWQFSVSKGGYDTNTWSQSITSPGTFHAFITASSGPPSQAPVHVSPGNGNNGIGTSPTFQWQPVSGATKYGFYISKPPYGEANLVYQSESLTGTSLVLPTTLEQGVTYYWNMRAGNDTGWGPFSTSWSFITQQTLAAPTQAPVLVSPGNGSGGVSTTPSFQWQSVSGATKYGFYISKPPYGEANLVYQSESLTGTSLVLPVTLEQGITYYWNMRAGNDAGWGPFSASWSFTTQQTAVTLTLYVHADSASGPIIPGATVMVLDAGGHSFNLVTNSSGYVTITGTPGTWNFAASKTGYETNSWSQSITSTEIRHAYLFTSVVTLQITGLNPSQPQAQPTRQWVTVIGTGFIADSQVIIRIGGSTYYIPSDRTEYLSSTQIRVYIGLTEAGTWSAQVQNPGGISSNIYSFQVGP